MQGLGAFREPRAEVGEVAAHDFLKSAGVGLLVAARHLYKVNSGNAFAAHELMDLTLDVCFPFPAAILAGEVIGRETDEQHLRFSQRAKDAEAPVVGVFDFLRVEEQPQRRGGELPVIGGDVIANAGGPAVRISLGDGRVVLPGVGDENVVLSLVGHGGIGGPN